MKRFVEKVCGDASVSDSHLKSLAWSPHGGLPPNQPCGEARPGKPGAAGRAVRQPAVPLRPAGAGIFLAVGPRPLSAAAGLPAGRHRRRPPRPLPPSPRSAAAGGTAETIYSKYSQLNTDASFQ